MNKQARNINRYSYSMSAWALLLGASLVLPACGGGGTGVGPASGQEPDPVAIDFPIAYVKRPIPVDDMGVQTQFTNFNLL